MAFGTLEKRIPDHYGRDGRVASAVGLILMGLVVIVTSFFFLLTSDLSDDFPYFNLLPWLLLLLVVILVPSTILYKQGTFNLANPLVLASWAFFVPGFVIGGTLLALGYSSPAYLALVQAPEISLPWTVVLVALG